MKFLKYIGLIVFIAMAGISFWLYQSIAEDKYLTNSPQETVTLYVPTGSNYEDLIKILKDSFPKCQNQIFSVLAERMELKNHVYPGKYAIHQPISMMNLIRSVRSGKRETVELTILPKWYMHESVATVDDFIESDSLSLLSALRQMGFPCHEDYTLLPNTYQFYWNTSGTAFSERMIKESQKYWSNPDRRLKAQKLGLSPQEIYILASIVFRETNHRDEMSTIAGVYINRLRKNIALQADPTVKFALGQIDLKRILNKHLVFDSPYNTYLNVGLPPGPISVPSLQSIEAVLNAEEHDYLYFCARPDNSGRHSFAKTYRAHINNANRFHNWLNSRNIR